LLLSGTVSSYVWSRKNENDGIAANAQFTGITIDQKSGNIFVCDSRNNLICRVTPRREVSKLAGSKRGLMDGKENVAEFNSPEGIFYDQSSESLLVCDKGNHKLRRVLPSGDVTTLCEIESPEAVIVTKSQTILVSTHYQIHKVTSSDRQQYNATPLAGKHGILERVNGRVDRCRFAGALGLAVHEASHSCFVTEYYGEAVRKITFTNWLILPLS